jgi:CysZ protein
MIANFIKAFGQLFDIRTQKLLWTGVGLALLTLALSGVAIAYALLPLIEVGLPWADWILDLLGGLAVATLMVLLFPATLMVTISLLLEGVCAAVEARHYPGLPPPRSAPLAEQILGALRLAGLAVGLNLLALPLYLLLPVINIPLYLALNGYLLSREFFEQAALRRMPLADAVALRRRFSGRVWLYGAGLAACAMIPIFNLTLPIIATAVLLHALESLRPTQRSGTPIRLAP